MAARALRTFKKSGARWLLTTHYPAVKHNMNIDIGQCRPVNLTLPPFGLPEPLEMVQELSDGNPRGESRSLGLWSLST